jgi:hypothetical protein
VCIGKCSKRTEVVNIRLTAIKGLEWCTTSECRGWQDISDMGRVEDGPTPERVGKSTKMVATEGTGDNSLVATFSNPVLLGRIGHGGLVLNAMVSQVGEELLRHILAATITAEALEAVPRLCLKPGKEAFETAKNIRFMTHQVDGRIPREVVSEDNKVRVTSR